MPKVCSRVCSSRAEAVRLLQELIRLDTVNPPGNETLAAELLRAYLEEAGVACELYARDPARANLVARIPGSGEGPSLLLLSHTDTVLADPAEWTVDPWSGALEDGCVWGRGALDMKGQVAASAVAIASLAREGFRPAGDLLFVATADEEVGEGEYQGLRWLCEEHPEAVRCDYAVNEGAGDRLELGGRVFYTCAAAEKASSPFRLLVHGRSGHAALPGIADNALVKAAALIERAAAYREEPQLGPETEGFLAAVVGSVPPAAEALEAARAVDPGGRQILEPLLTTTLSPTVISASHKRNVIPGLCDVTVDCRLRPGDSQEDHRPRAAGVVRPGRLRARVASPSGRHALVDGHAALGRGGGVRRAHRARGESGADLRRGVHGQPLAPASRSARSPTGSSPCATMEAELANRLVHSADERIDEADLELGVEFLRHAALAIGR